MRRGILFVVAIALIVALAAPASAYDVLYTRRTATTHAAGTFGLDATFYYFMADKGYDHEGSSYDFADNGSGTRIWVPIDLYYAFNDQFELGAIPGYLSDSYSQDGADDVSGSSLGDLWTYARWMFMPEPAVTAQLGVKIPLGDNEPDAGDLPTGSGQYDVDVALLADFPAGPGMFYGSLGYRYRMANETDVARGTEKYTPGSEVHFMLGYTYYLSEVMQLRFDADGYFGGDADEEITARTTVENSAENGVWINPAFEYTMQNGVLLGADFHYPLMGQNIPALWGFGLYVGWGS